MRNLRVAGCLLLLSTVSPCGVAQEKGPLPKVVSRARKLEVLGLVETPRGFTVSIKNNYDRAITAYSVSRGAMTRVVLDFTMGTGREIAPGAQQEIPFNVRANLVRDPKEKSAQMPPIEIDAVIFADGTSAGDFLAINSMMGQRAGRAAQLRRFLPMLKETLDLADLGLAAGLDLLIQKVHALSDALYGGALDTHAFDAHDVSAGLFRARQELVRDLGGIRVGGPRRLGSAAASAGEVKAPAEATAAADVKSPAEPKPPADTKSGVETKSPADPKGPAQLRRELLELAARYEATLVKMKISNGV